MQLNTIKFKTYVHLYPSLAEREEVDEKVKKLGRPMYVGKHQISEKKMSELTLGQYIMLTSVKTDGEFYTLLGEIFGIENLMEENAHQALSLISWVLNFLERINKMFSDSGLKPTQEEVSAGVKKLNFGVFGLVDWYAQRMKISHDEAEATPVLRVFKCYEIDNKQEAYKRQLQKVYQKKAKKASQGRKGVKKH